MTGERFFDFRLFTKMMAKTNPIVGILRHLAPQNDIPFSLLV